MYRTKGFAAAGLQIFKTKPASPMTRFGRVLTLLMVGPLALVVTISIYSGKSDSSMPLPQKKPDVSALMAAYAPEPRSGTANTSPYKSPFSGPQMDLYRDIFRLQAAGSLDEADRLIEKLRDESLMGHVLAQRYLRTQYKVSFKELKDWLDRYADHPQADRVAKLANARRPKGDNASLTKVLYAPSYIEEMQEPGMVAKTYQSHVRRTDSQDAQARALIRQVRGMVQKYEPSAALRLLNEDGASVYLDNVEKDRVRAIIAAGYLYAGKTDEALKLAGQALKNSGANAPMAGWIHGLSSWRLGQKKQAASSFESAASSQYATGWMKAAASYWTARAHQEAGHKRRAGQWLERAAEYPKTFYGLIAIATLDRTADLQWNAPRLSGDDERAILDSGAGQRAEKLLAAGEVTLAEEELRTLYISGNTERKKALLAYAYDRQLPSLSLRLAHSVFDGTQNAALYPEMPWAPNQGFRIDRALIHAIARQESRFNASAENKGSGATGLMQLMPRTAGHVAGNDMFGDAAGRALLKHPEVSLDLGQRYVEELLNNGMVGQDLLSLAIAYNAGPGRLAKWKAERADINDPLLFIETIPFAETRTYVERVLANYWIYRMKFDQPNDSLIAVTQGKWARYAAHDKGSVRFAAAD